MAEHAHEVETATPGSMKKYSDGATKRSSMVATVVPRRATLSCLYRCIVEELDSGRDRQLPDHRHGRL